MKREQIEEYLRASRLICSAIYLRKSRAEEHMSLEDTLSRHRAALIAYAEKYGYLVDPADIYESVGRFSVDSGECTDRTVSRIHG